MHPAKNANPINEIEVCDGEHDELAVWRDDELRRRLAAPDLLETIKLPLHALNTAPRFRVGDTDSYAIVSRIEAVIREAANEASS
jgi:hypothetical protein